MTINTNFRTPALLTLCCALAAAGCAGTITTAEAGDPDARGVPGFDTREYPGDAVMDAWRDASPYRWVGFYLHAPCYTGTSWQGKRTTLRDMGWGIAVLYVGEQDWPASPDESPAAASDEDRCTRSNLSADKGRTDGADAARAAAAEGFRSGTVVYLDVEPVDSVSEPLSAYVSGWTGALVEAGYAPGLYAHNRNAATLLALMEAAAGSGPSPRLWVASTGGFNLRRAPAESGFPAAIWQGRLDITEEWAGTPLRIDANVADRSNPSG